MHWLYPQLQNVFHTLANILKRNLDPGPLAALFGITDDEDDPHQTFAERRMVASASLLARHAVFLKRKDAAPPTLKSVALRHDVPP